MTDARALRGSHYAAFVAASRASGDEPIEAAVAAVGESLRLLK